MLLDRYILPLAETGFSIVLPLVLTLKTVQLSTQQHDMPDSNNNRPLQKLLTFWTTYWLIMCLVQFAGVNCHVRCLIAMMYFAQSERATLQLLSFYERSVVPFLCTLAERVIGAKVSEADINHGTSYLLEKVCYEPEAFTKSLLEIAVPPATPYPSPSFWSRMRSSVNEEAFQYAPDISVENIVPLEMARVRSPPPYPQPHSVTITLDKSVKTPGRSTSQGSLTRKPSKQSVRVSSWTAPTSQKQEQIGLSPKTQAESSSSSRIPSGDLVFDDLQPGDRRSFRGSIKGLFTT